MRMYVFAIVYHKADGEKVICPVLFEAETEEKAKAGTRRHILKEHPDCTLIDFSLLYTLEDLLLGWDRRKEKRD